MRRITESALGWGPNQRRSRHHADWPFLFAFKALLAKPSAACPHADPHARVYDDAGPARVSRLRHKPSCFLLDGKHQRPELVLRRSIPSLRTPLSTLRLQPHDYTRMTRGRWGSLYLHRDGLAPSTFRRSPGAPVHSIISDIFASFRGAPMPAGRSRYAVSGALAWRSRYRDAKDR